MKTKSLLIVLGITIFIIIGGVLAFYPVSSKSSQILATSNAKAYTVDATSFDWGKISYNGDAATKTFKIRNDGTDVLKLYNIRTSCHCTKAKAVISDTDSPWFGMSDVSSWIGEVKPGQEAQLTVKFDQRFHGPQGTGPIVRYISVETNDKTNSKLTFTLTGNVIK